MSVEPAQLVEVRSVGDSAVCHQDAVVYDTRQGEPAEHVLE